MLSLVSMQLFLWTLVQALIYRDDYLWLLNGWFRLHICTKEHLGLAEKLKEGSGS